jgi:hypothetical protein
VSLHRYVLSAHTVDCACPWLGTAWGYGKRALGVNDVAPA